MRFLPLDHIHTVTDYPYSFTLRTTATFSIEYKPKHGFRSVFQTVNPKTGLPNKPKHSTYAPFMRLYLDEAGHCHAYAFHPYDLASFQTAREIGLFEGVQPTTYDHVLAELCMLHSSVAYAHRYKGFPSDRYELSLEAFADRNLVKARAIHLEAREHMGLKP